MLSWLRKRHTLKVLDAAIDKAQDALMNKAAIVVRWEHCHRQDHLEYAKAYRLCVELKKRRWLEENE